MEIENPPAFPRDHRYSGHNGMSLRDWFAGQALCGLLASEMDADNVTFARGAYNIADAMLAARTPEAHSREEGE
jgi:hypothetical protein